MYCNNLKLSSCLKPLAERGLRGERKKQEGSGDYEMENNGDELGHAGHTKGAASLHVRYFNA